MLLAVADDNGCRFGHHCRRRASDYIKIIEVDTNKINIYFNLIVTTVFQEPYLSPNPFSRSPMR